MLVLTRRPGESIILGNNLIKIKVLNSTGQCVRLGIDADKDLSIHREEIYNMIKTKNEIKKAPNNDREINNGNNMEENNGNQ